MRENPSATNSALLQCLGVKRILPGSKGLKRAQEQRICIHTAVWERLKILPVSAGGERECVLRYCNAEASISRP